MFTRQPTILFITPHWPLGQTFGGQMRSLQVARTLREFGRVTVLVVGSNALDERSRRMTEAEFETESPVPEHASPTRSPAARLRRAIDPRQMNIHGMAASREDRIRVRELAARFNLVWVMNGRTPNILQTWHWPHTHLDIDDVPSTCNGDAARSGMLLGAKARVWRALLRRREALYPRRFTTLSVCSEADRLYLRHPDAHVIPNGFERPAVLPKRAPAQQPRRIGFIGLYSHQPNLEGMRWFFDEVWPQIRHAHPDIRFRLVGKDTDGVLRPDAPGTDVLGWMADPASEIATWSAMVIPIRSGGGTRIKIADAFSRKCPVISTTRGAHGYELVDGRQLRLADTPDAFAAACVGLIRDPAEAACMAQRAWADFLDLWTWDAIAPRILKAAEDCLRRSTAAPAS